jgi:aspartyl-tRNA(Asn)/glutamyl-tRNA(Gln) amidotransferase subunit B
MVMEQMIITGNSPDEVIKALWFDTVQSNDDEVMSIIEKILTDNPTVVEQYKWWKETSIGFFVGQVMKALGGKIDPNKAKKLIEELLKQ